MPPVRVGDLQTPALVVDAGDLEHNLATMAAAGGMREVVIDVNVGLPRCGCAPDDAGRLADRARAAGLEVRGVMGYEGHVVGVEDRGVRESSTADCMKLLLAAHEQVGGELVS